MAPGDSRPGSNPTSAAHTGRQALLRLSGSVVSLLFPAPCRLCAAPLRHPGRIPVCPQCLDSIEVLPDLACRRCGRDWTADEQDRAAHAVCSACRQHPPVYDAARSLAKYTGAGRELVHLLKYERIRSLAAFWAERLLPLAAAPVAPLDAVVAVPLSPARARARGFNQSAAIARHLAHRLELPFLRHALQRPRDAAPQASLSAEQRQRNVRGAFVASNVVYDRSLLLVDDVLTTGATASEATRALRDAGARRVEVLTAARADLYSDAGMSALWSGDGAGVPV